MVEYANKPYGRKYRCWISEEEKILSFKFVEGYRLMEFNTFSEFREYYCQKAYWGYKVQ